MLFELPMIALDVGSTAVRFVELTGQSNPSLKRFAEVALPKDVVQDNVIVDMEQLATVIRRTLQSAKVFRFHRRFCLSLGGSAIMIKVVRLAPGQQDEAIEDIIHLEAEQAFNYDIEELYYDFFLEKLREGETKRPCVIVSAKREIVEEYLALGAATKLKIGVADCDITAIVNLFNFQFPSAEGISAIVNLGLYSSQVVFIADGQYCFSRDLSISSQKYTREIAKNLEIEEEDAEELKIEISNQNPDEEQILSEEDEQNRKKILNLINDLNRESVSEISTTFSFFLQSGECPEKYTQIDNVFLCGGGAGVLGIDVAIATISECPVAKIDPFQNISIPKKLEKNLDQISNRSSFAIAVGLALRVLGEKIHD